LEDKYGWTITGIDGNVLTLVYKQRVELVFDINCFVSNAGQTAPIQRDGPLTVRLAFEPIQAEALEYGFFNSILQRYLLSFDQSATQVRHLLQTVSQFWDKVEILLEERRLLHTKCFTTPIVEDDKLQFQSILFLRELKTKAHAIIEISVTNDAVIEIQPQMKLVYGEKFNEGKMTQFLQTRISPTLEVYEKKDCGSWRNAVAELANKLILQKRK
jgi:kinetochore protein Spc7/SPC105